MKQKTPNINNRKACVGSVYIMTHSFFSDVVRIGCTQEEPQHYVKSLSAKTPGDYSLVFHVQCDNPCYVKKRIQQHLSAQEYVQDFYQVTPAIAKRLLTRATLLIEKLKTF